MTNFNLTSEIKVQMQRLALGIEIDSKHSSHCTKSFIGNKIPLFLTVLKFERLISIVVTVLSPNMYLTCRFHRI